MNEHWCGGGEAFMGCRSASLTDHEVVLTDEFRHQFGPALDGHLMGEFFLYFTRLLVEFTEISTKHDGDLDVYLL